jgi:hypothetical protein
MSHYHHQRELEAVVHGFELCTTGKDAFGHREHLAVVTWYLIHGTEEETLRQMREGILRFLNHHQLDTGIYGETITIFWIKVVRGFLETVDSTSTPMDVTNAVLERFQNSRLVYEYYTEDLLKSATAKSRWIEPNLKPL